MKLLTAKIAQYAIAILLFLAAVHASNHHGHHKSTKTNLLFIMFDDQSSFRPHMVLPGVLGQYGYKTASYGKIFHWETDDRAIWNYDHWDNGWYEYQEFETRHMNSSTMPDKVKREEDFRDYEFTTKAIETLRKLESSDDYYMVALGFKLPHLAVHVSYKYFDMYRDKTHMWRRHARELRCSQSSLRICTLSSCGVTELLLPF